MNISNEILEYFHLQKELIRLNIETKVFTFLSITSLTLAIMVIGFGILYIYISLISAIIYVALWLVFISIIALYCIYQLNRIRQQKEIMATALQMQLQKHLNHTETSPDFLLNLFQTIQMISDIIDKVKKMFQRKE